MAAFSTSSVFTASGHAGTVASAQVQGHIVDDLMPGHWNDVEFTVTNPNSYDVAIGTVSSPNYSPDVSVAKCANDFQIDWKLLTPLSSSELAGTPVPAGKTVTVKLTDAIGQYASSGDECQGAAVSLGLKVDFKLAPGAEAGLA